MNSTPKKYSSGLGLIPSRFSCFFSNFGTLLRRQRLCRRTNRLGDNLAQIHLNEANADARRLAQPDIIAGHAA